MSSNLQADPYHRGSVLSRSFLPLALITLGVVFLLSNLVPERGRGGLVVLGLGAAFLIGRVTTGRYGYAVPAGILLALGTFISLQELQTFQGLRGGGPFFVILGLGFTLIYLIGSRPGAVWPLFPATVMIGLGLVLFGAASFGALASVSWIVAYWPAVLVLLGLWLLFRDHLPVQARRPLATLGGVALLVYGILAAAASMATAGTMARTGFASFGAPPFAETITLDQPIAAGQTFNVNNPSGRTTIHANPSASNVHVVATRRFNIAGHGPDVQLTPTASGVTLDAPSAGSRSPFGGSNYVEYTVDVPANVAVKAQSSSGQIEIDGVGGEVLAEAGSGQLSLSNLGGAVQARTSSGSIQLSNIAGEVRATTNSGQISGTELRHVREATTSSGYVSLEGSFVDPAQVHTSSGSVNIKLRPESAVRLDVKTNSGSINPRNLVLANGVTQRDKLTGNIGNPSADATLAIETNSGSVVISQ
jgi:hypothetical protein